VSPTGIFESFSPHVRVATALVPFLLALVLRLVMGKSYFTRAALSLSTMWFAINVLLAPFAADLRQEIFNLAARLH
jgi:hypothetical protein